MQSPCHGEKQHSAKLRREDVVQIKREIASGALISKLARRFNVGLSTVCGIRDGRTWRRVTVTVVLVLCCGSVLAQQTKYEPTEVQLLRLQVKQKDAQLAQVQLQRAQQAFQGALAALDAEAGAVKKANNWPADVQFSPDTLTFEVPKLPAGQPEAKKP